MDEMSSTETYTIILSKNELNVIGIALGELPFRISAPVVELINKQILRQTTQPCGPDISNIATSK